MAGVQGGTHQRRVRKPATKRRGTQPPPAITMWCRHPLVFNGGTLAPPRTDHGSAAHDGPRPDLGVGGLRQPGTRRAFALLYLPGE